MPKWRNTQRRITLRDIASEAGVSAMTVSRVMDPTHGGVKVKPETRKRVEAAVQKLGYKPNLAARSLRSSKTFQIGAYVNWNDYHSMSTFGWTHIFGSLQREAGKYGYRLAFYFYENASEDDLRDLLEPGRYVDGLVVQGRNLTELEIREMRASRMPVVSLYETIPDFCSLISGDYEVGVNAANYLYKLGHRRVSAMAQRKTKDEWSMRYHGFIERASELGMDLVSRYFEPRRGPALTGWEKRFGYDNAPIPGDRDAAFSAIWIPSDFVAVGAVDRYEEEGMVVGRDLSVLSLDNSEAYGYAYWKEPRLSSFDLNKQSIGKTAAEKLCSGSFEANVHTFQFELVERTSVTEGPAKIKNKEAPISIA